MEALAFSQSSEGGKDGVHHWIRTGGCADVIGTDQ